MTAEEPLGKLILSVGALLPWIASLLISGGDTQATLEWARDNQWQAHAATILELVAVPFLLAGVLVYWRSTRKESSNLALLAAVGLTIGYVGLAALVAVGSPAPAPPSRIAALAGLALLTVPFATVVPALDPEVSSTLFWAGALFAWGGLALAPFRQSRSS